MAYGSGIGAQFGLARQTSIGTAVAVTRFHEFTSETLGLEKTIVQGQGLKAGLSGSPRAARRKYTTRSAGGDVVMDFPTVGAGKLLRAMTGSRVVGATQLGSTAAYIQQHANGSTDGDAFTLQIGVPQTDGTVIPKTYHDAKCAAWKISCALGAIVELTTTWDAWDETTATGLATASFAANADVFTFRDGALKLGGTASTTAGITTIAGGTTVATVTAAELNGVNPMKTDRFYFGSGGVKAEQVRNDNTTPLLTGSLAAEFTDHAVLYDRFAADTALALELTFVGSLIATPYSYTLDIVVPNIHFDGETPKVSGPDVVPMSGTFTALDNGADNVYELDYISTDTAA